MNQYTKDTKLIPLPMACLRCSSSVCIYIHQRARVRARLYIHINTHKSKQYMKQNALQENKKCYTTCYFHCTLQTSHFFWTLPLFFSMRNKRRLVGAACHHEMHWVQSVPKSQHFSVALSFHADDNGLPA